MKIFIRLFATAIFILLMVLNISITGNVDLKLNESKANIENEATCYSSTKDCSWYASCWDIYKCGSCIEIESKRRDDAGTCYF